ncbi:DUF1289 domain-containing protein [Noviherbaspirillum sedimenti]|uniref:DUF1289 domain-containing protein n=1 Tax=Noviherbaspirillum sedimenti TaxID=2320865 RepID=A0A3A3G2Y9_9BURK|nr:DUF1289 domain-containing protein [Noviherbaspirillum sedimenti]RJG02837.1 DUF1289 domain-containing protein [Noviherbaspirillum sedimenti]
MESKRIEDDTRVSSPCIGICRMNAFTGLCAGCDRSMDEIVQWSSATDDEKRAIWQLIRQRRQAPR